MSLEFVKFKIAYLRKYGKFNLHTGEKVRKYCANLRGLPTLDVKKMLLFHEFFLIGLHYTY